MPRVTHVLFDMDDVLAVRSTEATCASLAASSGLSAQQVMERLYVCYTCTPTEIVFRDEHSSWLLISRVGIMY